VFRSESPKRILSEQRRSPSQNTPLTAMTRFAMEEKIALTTALLLTAVIVNLAVVTIALMTETMDITKTATAAMDTVKTATAIMVTATTSRGTEDSASLVEIQEKTAEEDLKEKEPISRGTDDS